MDSEQSPEAINSRTVLRGYAVAAALAGFLLLGWGPMWLGADLAGAPWAKAALIRVFGSIGIAAGCCAAGMAAAGNPSDRRRGLLWLAVAHAVLLLVVLSQRLTIWGPGLGERAAQLLWAVVFVLFYLWSTGEGELPRATLTTLFGGNGAEHTDPLRSRYEQQIRQAAAQEERNRLARDLHDSIKQQIFVIQTAAATAQARFDADPPGARQALDQVRMSAREATTEMQVMLEQLRAVSLENTGLIEGIKRQGEALGFRTGARVDFQLGSLPQSDSLAPGAHEAVLRVAQEALANVGRHARAGSVLVSLGSIPGRTELVIEDDGKGFDTNQRPRGMGIANMRARAAELGGTFELDSRPGGGTRLRFAIPYRIAGTAAEYRHKLLTWAAVLAVSLLPLVTTRSFGASAASTVALIGVVRYALAYRRTRERRASEA